MSSAAYATKPEAVMTTAVTLSAHRTTGHYKH